ncbi:MAG: hypothetical protein IMF14_09490 [Proteobacteria bacterium]|nr:hypothetical protein [Pseudomonadota bacterium]
MAILGIVIPPATWISAAAIVLITLVNGKQSGMVATALALIGAALFAFLIFSAPQVAIIFALLAWLPAWLAAMILRQTVSMAYSLQVLTGIAVLAVLIIYALFPDFGEHWRETLDEMVMQLAEQSEDFSLAELKQTEDWIIGFLPGLFASSLMFGTMLSLFLGRWWQAALYNQGGFAKEFQSMNLGKTAAMIAVAVLLVAVVINSMVTTAVASVVLVLYGMQALSIMHAAINIRRLNGMWLFALYLTMFFIPQLLLVLILVSLADPWLDVRQRLMARS